jgi:hypothetical protein
VPVPLPRPETTKLTPPDLEEATATACGIASLGARPGGLTPLQATVPMRVPFR